MGREIRRVPPNWNHPVRKYCMHRPSCEICFQPLRDQTYDNAALEWIKNFEEWQTGKRPEYYSDDCEAKYFWDWDGMPPDQEYYRTYSDEEATWYQVYETVSEGTPVTPPFETKEEIINYLVEYGDFWGQRKKEGGFSRKAAENFVNTGWAMSMMISNGEITVGINTCEEFK